MQAQSEAMAEIQAECRHLAFETDIGRFGQLLGSLVGAQTGLQHPDSIIHPLPGALIRVTLRLRGTANGESAVVACAVTDEGMDDVEIRLITRTNQPVREIVRMRAAPFSRNGIDRFDAVGSHLI